jgi:hypothetical protein
MMKFLYDDLRTWQLSKSWRTDVRPVRAAFFFHHRGDASQKSFEGLIRSIISQLLEDEQDVFVPLLPLFQEPYRQLLHTHDLGSLRRDLIRFIEECGVKLDHRAHTAIAAIWECQYPRRKLREIVKVPLKSAPSIRSKWLLVEQAVLSRKSLIINPPKLDKLRPDVPEPTPERQLRDIKPPIYRPEWDDVTTSRFLSLVLEWREAIDIRAKLTSLVALEYPDPKSYPRKRLAPMIDDIVQRQQRREFYQPYVESETWSKSKLDKALKLVIDQEQLPLDLFLFLDALDEYDGPTEFIADFLTDLVKENKSSHTRIRILFSSRPWNVFVKAFESCPGFDIHDHTHNDIRQVCAKIMQADAPEALGRQETIRLIPNVVQRARGVFLWVKLVMHDLCRHAADCIAAGMDSRDLRKQLLRTLETLPDNLVDYYAAIIDRISPDSRWETYCLLETVCRSYQPTYLHQLPFILACAPLSCYEQLQETSASLKQISITGVDDRLRDVSGGLVEVIDVQSAQMRARQQLQLLHQTMLEFVEQPQFKNIALGPLSYITVENGHTFLVKYQLCWHKFLVNRTTLRHAYQSEKTTGVGLYDVLRGGTFTMSGYLLERDLSSDTTRVRSRLQASPVGVAVAGMLHLTLKQALDEDEEAIAKASESESFLSLVMWSLDKDLCQVEEAVAMIRFLSAHGCKLEQDILGLSQIVIRDRRDISFERPFDAHELEELIKAALDGCTHVELHLPTFPDGDIYGKPLHFCHLGTTMQYLLDRGAHPNSLRSDGATPLDVIVESSDPLQDHLPGPEEQHDMCRVLTQAGGKLRICSAFQWETLMIRFRNASLEEIPFPGSYTALGSDEEAPTPPADDDWESSEP